MPANGQRGPSPHRRFLPRPDDDDDGTGMVLLRQPSHRVSLSSLLFLFTPLTDSGHADVLRPALRPQVRMTSGTDHHVVRLGRIPHRSMLRLSSEVRCLFSICFFPLMSTVWWPPISK